MRRSAITVAAAVLLATGCQAGESQPGQGGVLWPWQDKAAPKPPPIPPYELPTFGGDKRDFRAPPAPWHKGPQIDGDEIFRMIIACYPARSQWQIDVDLTAALRSTSAVDVTGTQVGRATVGLVARMPLYAASELDREREREYRRRTDTANTVAEYAGQIAARNEALRRLALAAAMERRSQIRVAQGIANADEQARWLDKIGDAERDVIASETRVQAARLKLVGQCRDDAVDAVNDYLRRLAAVPQAAVP